MVKARALFASLMIVSGSVSAADTCIQSAELKADQTRFVETQLRIATLQCVSGSNRDLTGLYNNFVREKRPYFIEAETPLRQYLKRSGMGKLSSYVVKIANRISLDSIAAPQFCDRARTAIALSAKMPDPAGLVPLMPVRYQAPARTCAVASNQSAYQ